MSDARTQFQKRPMPNWQRWSFGLSMLTLLLGFAIVMVQTASVFFNGDIPSGLLLLSTAISVLVIALLSWLLIAWRGRHPLLSWLPALLALPLFISILVGVCPRCDWSMRHESIDVGDVTVSYDTTAFSGQAQVGVLGDNGLWVADMRNNRIVLLDAETHAERATLPTGRNPVGVARGHGSIWTANYNDGTVSRLNEYGFAPRDPIHIGGRPTLLAVTENAVWVTDQEHDVVSRIDPDTNTLEATIETGRAPVGIAASKDGIWVAQSDVLVRIDPDTNEIAERVVTAPRPLNLAVTSDSIWIVSPTAERVQRFDLITKERLADIAVGGEPTGIAVDDQFAWVTRSASDEVVRIDVANNELVGEPIPTRDRPLTVTVDGEGGVWVMEDGAGGISRVRPGGVNPAVAGTSEESWFAAWAEVSTIMVALMATTSLPFLVTGWAFLSLALAALFWLEPRHAGQVPTRWMLLLIILLVIPSAIALLDLSFAISLVGAQLISFFAVVGLTRRAVPESEVVAVEQDVDVVAT